MTVIEKLITERPQFHCGETEISRAFGVEESLLPPDRCLALAEGRQACYGLDTQVLRFLADATSPGIRSLETGAGLSTLVLAARGAEHTAVTPASSEAAAILAWASAAGLDMAKVAFVQEPSEVYLPRAKLSDLDLVLLDGKHAFPWPVMDWFFTAEALNKGGLMIVDDVQMRSVRILVEFMDDDIGWERVEDFGGKTVIFRKTRERVLDVAWHMQRWMAGGVAPSQRTAAAAKPRRRWSSLFGLSS